jgi:hypothetical protein
MIPECTCCKGNERPFSAVQAAVDRLVRIVQTNQEMVQPALTRMEEARRLCTLVAAVWVLVRTLGVLLIQEELARRAATCVD